MKKMMRAALVILAAAWIALVLLEKWTNAANALMMRRSAWPVRAGHKGTLLVKSVVLGIMMVINVFMALALTGTKGSGVGE
jgi:hypothetical protein